MLRFLVLTAVLCAAAAPVQARAFRQTYGATVATADGGCTWNMSMDYFVPRTCDSCRYDLFSACKTSHTTSPACINQHPIYGGYCTPYASCRYKWRDHVYKKHCGCTPLACTYGPWDLEKCCKHGCGKHGCGKHCRRTPDPTSCGIYPGGCGVTPLASCADGFCAGGAYASEAAGYGGFASVPVADVAYLPNVEPYGVEVIGTVEAFPIRMGGGGMGSGMAMPMGMSAPMPGAAAMPGMIPGVPQPTNMPAGLPGGGGFAYPNF
jgi:hypothetical protein